MDAHVIKWFICVVNLSHLLQIEFGLLIEILILFFIFGMFISPHGIVFDSKIMQIALYC